MHIIDSCMRGTDIRASLLVHHQGAKRYAISFAIIVAFFPFFSSAFRDIYRNMRLTHICIHDGLGTISLYSGRREPSLGDRKLPVRLIVPLAPLLPPASLHGLSLIEPIAIYSPSQRYYTRLARCLRLATGYSVQRTTSTETIVWPTF